MYGAGVGATTTHPRAETDSLKWLVITVKELLLTGENLIAERWLKKSLLRLFSLKAYNKRMYVMYCDAYSKGKVQKKT